MGSLGWTNGLGLGWGFAISQAFTAHPPPGRTKSQSTLDAWIRVKILTFYGLEQKQQLNIFCTTGNRLLLLPLCQVLLILLKG